MSLRHKTLLIIGLILVSLLTILYGASQTIILDSFSQLEDKYTREHVQRVLNTLDNQLAQLASTAEDWGHWDDTYQFIQDGNQDYITHNLTDSAIKNLEINLMIFVDVSGKIVHSKTMDLNDGHTLAVPPDLREYLTADSPPLNFTNETGKFTGIIQLSEGTLLVASTRILNSFDQGPMRGTLIFGRYLDNRLAESLSQTLEYPITAYPIDDPNLPVDFQTVHEHLTFTEPVITQPMNANMIGGYALIFDSHHRPAAVIRVEIPRDIYREGQRGLKYTLTSFVIIGVASIVMVLLLLERTVLSKLAKLSSAVRHIQDTKEFTMPISLSGDDELARLAVGMRGMLEALAQSHNELRRAHDELEQRVQERTLELTQANTILTREIAERERAQIALAEAHYQTVRALEIRKQIIANVSHDARTPISIIILRAELLQNGIYGELAETQVQMLNTIILSAREMLGFVNNLLDEAQITSGEVKLNSVPCNPRQFLEQLHSSMEPLAARKGLTLLTHIAEEVPTTLYVDKERLTRILSNLIDNAIKFTNQGQISVHLRMSDETHIAFEIADTGQGISPEALPRIFDPFWQEDGSITRKAGRGIGLGLSIVKQLVEAMGGQVIVESELGQGTKSIIILPCLLRKNEAPYAHTAGTHC